jgi:hypothetical protein
VSRHTVKSHAMAVDQANVEVALAAGANIDETIGT